MQTYTIELHGRMMASNATPIEGKWYVGIDHQGRTGAIAQYVGGQFECSAGVVDMTIYQYLQLSTRHQLEGEQAVAGALRWLETLIQSPSVPWDPQQKEAAQEALVRAKAAI